MARRRTPWSSEPRANASFRPAAGARVARPATVSPPAEPDGGETGAASPDPVAGERLLVGIFGAPHGVRGELRLKSYTADPASIAGYTLTDAAGRRNFGLVEARLAKDDILVVRLAGVDDRDAAAALTNTKVYVDRAALPPPDPDEFYHADLVGLRVETTDGTVLGRVAAVLDFGAGDILEIEPADGGRPMMLPFTLAAVPVVDIPGGRLVAEPPVEVIGEDPADNDSGEPDGSPAGA